MCQVTFWRFTGPRSKTAYKRPNVEARKKLVYWGPFRYLERVSRGTAYRLYFVFYRADSAIFQTDSLKVSKTAFSDVTGLIIVIKFVNTGHVQTLEI